MLSFTPLLLNFFVLENRREQGRNKKFSQKREKAKHNKMVMHCLSKRKMKSHFLLNTQQQNVIA